MFNKHLFSWKEVLILPAKDWCSRKKNQIRLRYLHEDRCTVLGVWCYGYIPLSHSETRHYENWTYNIILKRNFIAGLMIVGVIVGREMGLLLG